MNRRDNPMEGVLPWLLEEDAPGVRYLAMRDLLDLPPDAPELRAARAQAHENGPIAAILAEMNPEGYWSEPGAGYLPKYYSTVWCMTMLAQLGAAAALDERISAACAYVLDHSLTPLGQFTSSGAPSGTADCLQGNLCAALVSMGYEDPRLGLAYEWMARTVTGEVLPRTQTVRRRCAITRGNVGRILPVGRTTSCPAPGVPPR